MGVSVVIPSFERPLMLKILLKSIQSQSYKNFEVIVVDDCSSNVEEIEKAVNEFQGLMEIRLIKKTQRKGAPHSRNLGIHASKYEYIALVDDDDEWKSEKLTKQMEIFESSGEKVGIVYTWTEVVTPQKDLVMESRAEVEGKAKKEILSECFIPSPSVMVRKKAIIEAGLFDEEFPSCQDWDTWTRIIFKGYEVRVCKEFLTFYVKHDGPTIGTSKKAKNGFIKFYRKHFWKCSFTLK